ncbi:hypothetical protein [Tsuneonella amylolytica]|uniref:hypothetical protein n=1 Tax=Tsuneonella amylolytica TaxID=2338327 RepID=UPI001F448B26|nr:hypothetical protein [Tsuneonella amylolytica]
MRYGKGLAAIACLAASMVAGTAHAETAIDIDRAVYVERAEAGGRALEPASTLRKGDKVVLVVAWTAPRTGRRFTVQSAIPATLAFQRTGSDATQVSIDGGRTWGELGTLRAGDRLASAEDVTHVRQQVSGPRQGRMTFSAIVR